jgi:hypothetical protein
MFMAKGYKTGGRAVGTPNKVTSEIRDALTSIVLLEIENYANKRHQTDFAGAKYSMDALRVLLPFILPKPQGDCNCPEPVVITIPTSL